MRTGAEKAVVGVYDDAGHAAGLAEPARNLIQPGRPPADEGFSRIVAFAYTRDLLNQ